MQRGAVSMKTPPASSGSGSGGGSEAWTAQQRSQQPPQERRRQREQQTSASQSRRPQQPLDEPTSVPSAAVPASASASSTSAAAVSAALLVSLSARHLPPGLDPLACVLLVSRQQTSGGGGGSDASASAAAGAAGAEALVGHTEVVRSAVCPQWQRLIAIDCDSSRGRMVRIALFDAAHVGETNRRQQPRQQEQHGGRDEDVNADTERRSSPLFDRMSLLRGLSPSQPRPSSSGKRNGSGGSSGGSGGDQPASSPSMARAELRSEDAIGSVVLPLDDLCQPQRYHVQQRLPLRHTFDAAIDRRLQRLNAHLLVTVRPHSLAAQFVSPSLSPLLSGVSVDSWTNGPPSAVSFEAAYRLLCRGAEMWKFAYSSSSARPQRRLVFYARHPLSAAQLQETAESVQPADGRGADDSAAPNPLFPLGLLYWCRPGKRVCDSARCVPLHSITALYERCQTAAFASVLTERGERVHRSIRPAASAPRRQSHVDSVPLELGFSLVTPQRTLDLVPDTSRVRDAFLAAIHGILMQHQRICYEDNSEARLEEAKRTEELRRFNERQLAGAVTVSFSLQQLPLSVSRPDAVDTQIRLVLNKQLTFDGEAAALPSEDAPSEALGSSEWVEVDELLTFAHTFTLSPPASSTAASTAEQYHLSVVDLSHRTLGTATFSSQLLVHHHIDIPLAVRHTVQSIDSLLTFNRTCVNMRLTPLTGRDTMRADVLDVIALLQAQPSAPIDLPYITLAFMLRGEPCDYYHAPAFTVTRTTLQYSHDSRAVQVAGHCLPLTSLVHVHRQLKQPSELTDSLCAVHPEKRVNSRRVLVVHTVDCGSFVCEMRSVMAADAWVAGIRQLLADTENESRRAARTRTDIEHEQLSWAGSDIGARDSPLQQNGDSDNDSDALADSETSHRFESATAIATDSTSPTSVELTIGEAAFEESELRVSALHPTAFLSFSSPLDGLLPLHALLHSDERETGTEHDSATGECEMSDPSGGNDDRDASDECEARLLSSVDLANGHLVPRSHHTAARRLSHSSGLRSPLIHSRSASFSSLQQPGFHITPPSSPHSTQEEARVEVDSERAHPLDVDIPSTPPLLSVDSDIPSAPALDVPVAPPLSDGSTEQQAASAVHKLRRLHWDALSGEADARGTIFEALNSQLDQTTVDAIEKLFAAVAPSKPNDEPAATVTEPAVRAVELIERRRAQNVSIALHGLKTSVEAIVGAIVECDMRLLSVERLQQLIACLPDAIEAKQIKAYVGEPERLGPAEQFMHATLRVPRCAVRLQLLLFVATYDDAVSQLSAHCICIRDACDTLRASDRLAAAMQGVLAVGGLLSGKRASGFRLSSLDKLHALKSQQLQSDQQQQRGQFSLLDFIVEREVSRAQTDELIPPQRDRLFFDSLDIHKLHSAAKLDWQAVQTDIHTLHEQLRAVRREMDRAEQHTPPQHHSRSQSHAFAQQPQQQQQPSSVQAAGGQAALHRSLKSFLGTGLSAFHRLSALHVSTAEVLRVTQSYFAESDGSPQSLFASFERFIANFTASERRYWDKLDKQQRRAAIQARKQQLLAAQLAGTQQHGSGTGSRGGQGAAQQGQHFSYVDAKRASEAEADSSRTLDARITYAMDGEHSADGQATNS